VICPNCREDNAPNFRFCGMCGTPLEPRRPASAPALDPLAAFSAPALQRTVNAEQPRPAVAAPVAAASEVRAASKPVPPISGPSMLGLSQPSPSPSTPRPTHSEWDLSPSGSQPTTDILRERAFSGLDSFLEPEEPKTGGRRIVLLLVLLAALGGAAWWTYTNYLNPAEKRAATNSPLTSSTTATEAPSDSVAKATQESPTPDASKAASAAPTGVPEGPSENASTSSDGSPKSAPAETKTVEITPEAVAPAPKAAAGAKHQPKPLRNLTPSKPAKAPQTADTDSGDADFRKGEAYLYGRGKPENCDEAVKNLKAASAKSSAKARSAFGTMYATGHCVPRDLPTSYSWFALALRVDPNNQILEKDLNAVWNQMTPPERQMATRAKQ
jgi:hypothetical protein